MAFNMLCLCGGLRTYKLKIYISTKRGNNMQKYDEAKIKAMQAANLAKAIEYAGGQARLAKYLGVASHQVVHNWVQRGRISATCAKKVEELTGGKIKKEQLRPDVIVWTADK